MATFACVSLPSQFITPPPSTSNCTQHNDSDCGSSTGTSGGEMKTSETASDDGSTTSSHSTPPEYPSPPPPSNSPPESMASLQADSPILDERDTGGTGPRRLPMRTAEGEPYVEVADGVLIPASGVNCWMVQNGYHDVPWEGPLPPQPQSILFVHVNEGEMLSFTRKEDNAIYGNLVGPGTVRMIGDPGATSQPLPIQLRPGQQCHQFIDDEGNLRHVVLSLASPDSASHIPRELNVPQTVGSQQLMKAIGGIPNDRANGGTGENHGNADNSTNGGNQNHGNVVNAANVEVVVNGGNMANGNNGHHFVHTNGAGQYYQQRGPPRNNRGGGRGQGSRNGHSHDGYAPRYYNGGRGGGRGNRQYNGKGREYQGHSRDNGNQYMIQGNPEMMNGHDQSGLVLMNPDIPGVLGAPIGGLVPTVAAGQISLLGEPTGPPMPTPAMMQSPPPPFQQQLMTVPPPELPPDMDTIPQVVNGIPVQSGLIQDPTLPGSSMSVPPPIYGVPPSNGMMMISSNGAPSNNNNWLSYRTLEDMDRLHEILSKLGKPSVANVLPTEVQFLWMPIKLGDFLVSMNGVVLSLENIEITYEATVTDNELKPVMIYPMELDKVEDNCVGKVFRAHSLRPNSSYHLTIKAMSNQWTVMGKPTPLLPFRTAPGRPEPPNDVHVVVRGTDFLHLVWHDSINNGAFVSAYNVYIHENEYADGRMLQVTVPEAFINELNPETRYKITINALNALGESLTGYQLEIWTKPTAAPLLPQNIRLTAISHRSIRVNWDANPNCFYWIELYDTVKNTNGIVREHFGGNSTVIGELESNREYHVRLIARNDFGETPSDWIVTRTQVFRKMENGSKYRNNHNEESAQRQPAMPNVDRPPSAPTFKRYVDNYFPEMEWKSHGPGQRDFVYVAEGSTYETPEKFIQLYRGSAHSLIVMDNTIHYLRVYIIHKKGQRSQISEKVVVPRDYSQYRPDRVVNIKMFMTNDSTVVAQWPQLDRKVTKLPETAVLLYFVQRFETAESPIIGTGEANQCAFENVPEETTVNVRVRAAVSFHDSLVHGDWSTPVLFTTPRSLPPAVINISYNSKTSLLSWDCLDQSLDLQFTVEVFNQPVKTPLMKVTTKLKNSILDGVQPGQQYTAVLSSHTNVGRTLQHSTFDFTTPALKPSAPEEGMMVSSTTEKCSIAWTAAAPNGSPVTAYVFKLHLNKKLLRESVLPTHAEKNYRVNMKDLKPNTVYLGSICGRNAIGDGEPVNFPITTQPLPPVAPEIECDPESGMLKLHWDNVTSSPSISYKVTRLNGRGQHVTVYEGENNMVKVKNLAENSEYSFQLKVTDKITGGDAMSEIFTFKTLVAPPPPIKQSPTSALVNGHSYLYLVSWKDVLPKNNFSEQFYRLQVVDATIQGAKWSVVYEGTTPSFELNTESFPGALHVRVLAVRPQKDKELKGSPSPVGYMGNVPPVVEVNEDNETDRKRTLINWNYFGIHPIIILFSLALFMVIMIFFSETLFHWLTGSADNGTPPATGAPQQPPSPITPTRPPGAE